MKKKPSFPKEKVPFKVMSIWTMLIFLCVIFWTLGSDQNQKSQKYDVRQLMNAASDDSIVEFSIKNVPQSGKDWYVISGKVKNPRYGKDDDASAKNKTLGFNFEGRLTDSAYNKLTDPASPWKIVEQPAGSFFKDLLLTSLPILLLIAAAYFFIYRNMRASGKSALTFGKSRAKLLNPDQAKTTFDDVAGCDESKEEVAEVVEFLKNPKKFIDIGAKIPKGLLMVGPPGTGKTLLARAIAGEANVPFYSISGSDFVEMFVGVGASRVRDMFEQARKTAPCLVFVDEIDAVGRQRGTGLGGGHDEREQTLNSLLVEMDGFDGHEGVIIIAATNRPDVLDSALLRPGRFDRQVLIDLPDLIGREEILKVHAKKIKLAKDADLKKVAQMTAGCSGADLANILNESAIVAARHNAKQVSNEDFEIARDKIFYGRERRKLMDESEKRLTAFHEAGHALIQCILDDGLLPVHKVTIIPRGQSLGSTMFSPTKDIHTETKNNLLNRICAILGGRVAEEIFMSDISNGAAGDIKQSTKIAKKMVCDWGMSDLGPLSYNDNQEHIFLGKEISRSENLSEHTAQRIDEEIKNIIDTQLDRARKIATDNKDKITQIAEELLVKETLDGSRIAEIVKGIAPQKETSEDTQPSSEQSEPIAKEEAIASNPLTES